MKACIHTLPHYSSHLRTVIPHRVVTETEKGEGASALQQFCPCLYILRTGGSIHWIFGAGTGGASQVSIVLTCERTGVMQSRLGPTLAIKSAARIFLHLNPSNAHLPTNLCFHQHNPHFEGKEATLQSQAELAGMQLVGYPFNF